MPTQAIQEAIRGVIVQISIFLTPNRGVTVREMDSNARKVQIRIFFVSIVSRKTPKPCIFQFAKPQISCFSCPQSVAITKKQFFLRTIFGFAKEI